MPQNGYRKLILFLKCNLYFRLIGVLVKMTKMDFCQYTFLLHFKGIFGVISLAADIYK